MADGHGGIASIAKTGTSGLVDTYTITYADATTSTFTVTNGKAISSVTQYWKASSSNSSVPSSWSTTRETMTTTNKYLWSYVHYAFNDGTSTDTTKSVIGVYGDTGQQTYVWIRYAAQQPTSDADMGVNPDKWIGIYVGTASTAPTTYTSYTWYQYKGEKGDTGDAATIVTTSVTYQQSDSGTVVPDGSWTTTIPSPVQGKFLWTRTIVEFNSGAPVAYYSVSRYGIDGAGSVISVNEVSPDANGNVALTATDIPVASDNRSIVAHLDDKADVNSTVTNVTYSSGVLKRTVNGVDATITTAETTASNNSTNLITSGAVYKNKPINCSVTASAGSTATLNDSRITSTMRVLECQFGTPANVASIVGWSTSSGSITFTGTFTGSTTINFILAECNG